MIVFDTTVLVYAVGDDHMLREPAIALVEAVASGRIQATTTVEVIQEFSHVRARRRDRRDAAALARSFVDLFSPLLAVAADELRHGLRLFERHPRLGCFDAVLAAATAAGGHEALVSADVAFAGIRGVRHIDLANEVAIRRLLA